MISKTQQHFEHHSAASSGQERIRWIARGRMSVNDEFHLARIGQVGEDCFLLIMLCGGEPSNGSHVCIDAQVACWFERKSKICKKFCQRDLNECAALVRSRFCHKEFWFHGDLVASSRDKAKM